MRRRRQRGVITVFVTLMMVPVVVITGIMVDFARIKLYSSQAVMAADAYGEAILSEYDNLLKELYGLFSVTQNEDGKKAIETMKSYVQNSFNPNQDDKGLSGFMPYKSADVDLAWEAVSGASLSNNTVLMTQISDFMKYRIVEVLLEDDSILETLSEFDNTNSDMDAMEDRNALTDSSQEALEEISNYYSILEKINDYPAFLLVEQSRFESYSSKLTEIAAGEDYADYVEYLANKSDCDAALEKKKRIENSDDEDDDDEEDDEDEVLTDEEEELADLAERVADYGDTIVEEVTPLQESAWTYTDTGKKTDYESVKSQITNLGISAAKIEQLLTELEHRVTELEGELGSCSEAVREGIQNEIQELEDILELKNDFTETYRLIETVNRNTQKSQDNKEKMDEELEGLDDVFTDLEAGAIDPESSDWSETITFEWYNFRDNVNLNQFYIELQQLCGSSGTGGDKDAGDKKKNEAKEAQTAAENELNNEETSTAARDISDTLASQLQSSGATSGTVPSVSSYFSGGLSFDAIGQAGNNLIDKFLVTTYDFKMFSSRVTGVQSEDTEDTTESGDSCAVSLTGYKISEKINYLYGAELEYLLGGHNSSKDNLNETRNIICGIRLTMNFASTYSITEINQAISEIADAAAAAVAASGVGAAVAPLVRVAVSGALRAAIATMETAADWNALKSGEKVVFFKTKLNQMTALSSISSLLEGKTSETAEKSDEGLQLSYEDYLYVLICLLINSDTLMSRTSNLITLNVNQAQNTGDTLTTLTFKMSDTVTAVKSTCKVKMDFAVTPDNFIKMYLSGTSGESMIETLENEYFGYSVIRGY